MVHKEMRPNDHHYGNAPILYYMNAGLVAKGSPIKELFWTPIQTLLEAGILNKIKRGAMDIEPEIPRETLRKNKPLVILQYAPVFMMYATGFLISVLSFVVEILGKRKQTKTKE